MGTSRNRAVWYWAATRPRLVRQGEPAGAAQEDIGQSSASTCRKSFSLTRGSFHGGVSSARPYATTRETRFALFGIWRPGCFTGPSPVKQADRSSRTASHAKPDPDALIAVTARGQIAPACPPAGPGGRTCSR